MTTTTQPMLQADPAEISLGRCTLADNLGNCSGRAESSRACEKACGALLATGC